MDPLRKIAVAIVLVSSMVGNRAPAQVEAPQAPRFAIFREARVQTGMPVVRVDAEMLAGAKRAPRQQGFVVEGFPLPLPPVGGARLNVDLELAEFTVTSPTTRYVVGQLNAPDRELAFDPDSFTFLRGTVRGYPASHVFIAVSERLSTARIDLGPGHPRFLVSDRGGAAAPLEPGELIVFPATEHAAPLAGVPACAVTPAGAAPAPHDPSPPPPPAPRGGAFIRGLQQIQLAVETDYELFELFGSAQDTAAYVTAMYAAVSDIYIRDVNSRVALSFVRIWDTPNDMFNDGEDPLGAFQAFWNSSMQTVPRDVAQLFTGRRNLSAGGVAYLNGLCSSNGYSWAGYALGFFSDPDRAHWDNRDIMIAAHEIGHNCGTLHSHDYGLDACDNENTPPRRGSIMSYCGQTFSGGDANHDLWFHEFTADLMRDFILSLSCIADDCDANNIHDVLDISAGRLHDVNLDGVPDECQDCNGNGILDPVEIQAGSVPDVNSNLIPDPCEPDCNGNQLPDTFEIMQTPLIDLNANRIPDLCEGDRNSNAIADYNEIQANMALDVNRNVMLDSTEDCDGDELTDIVELDHAWNCYIGSAQAGAPIREYFSLTGVQMNVFAQGQGSDVQDLVITPDRRILVSRGANDRIDEFRPDGSLVGTLVASGSGGLDFPGQMILSRANPATLLVASHNTNQVLEYDLATGAFIRVLVGGADAPDEPFGLTFSPAGTLMVTSHSQNSVREFEGQTGAFVRVFVTPGAGSLLDPRGLLFKPDGNLLVCSSGNDRINEYDGGTGAFIRRWSRVGTPTRLTFENPWCIRLGPDGDVYASRSDTHAFAPPPPELHLTNARVYQFDIRNGNMVRAYLQGVDSALTMPTGFDFMPGDAADCNQNHLPDQCDISAGISQDCDENGVPDDCDIRFGAPDVNGDGIPDSCQCLPDWNQSGKLNSQDFFDFIRDFFANMADFNGSGGTDSQDFFDFLQAFFTGC